MDRYRTIPGPYGTYGIWDDDRKCWHTEGQAITWEWRTAKPLCDKLNGTGKAPTQDSPRDKKELKP